MNPVVLKRNSTAQFSEEEKHGHRDETLARDD